MTLLEHPDVTGHASTDFVPTDFVPTDFVPTDFASTVHRVVAEIDILAANARAIPWHPDDEPARSSYARCADGNGTLTHLFFSDDEFDLARAKSICGKCGLAAACLAGAIERAEVYGVWGGQLLIDGEIIAVKRGRGRPPKSPRPPLVVDEVPVPPHLVA